LKELSFAGIDYDDIVGTLEREGIREVQHCIQRTSERHRRQAAADVLKAQDTSGLSSGVPPSFRATEHAGSSRAMVATGATVVGLFGAISLGICLAILRVAFHPWDGRTYRRALQVDGATLELATVQTQTSRARLLSPPARQPCRERHSDGELRDVP